MVYDWDGKRDVCYDLYIVQRQSLEEIMAHMREIFAFTPSKRAFQTQFKRWGFPSKQNPAHKNLDLVSRVKQLWESNTSQREMLRILNDEGYDIKERELMRVRAKNRWLLRVPNGMKSQGIPDLNPGTALAAVQKVSEEAAESEAAQPGSTESKSVSTPPEPAPEVLAKRKARREEMQKESDERYATRKRRRRTRGWGGLPADPPGPPRFPSETTIEESKQLLNLDGARYREMRDFFQRICEENRVIKKTLAGPERWQAVKNQLIEQYAHLQSVFWTDQTRLDAKTLALDVICTDVTKRMRTLENRMTIAEAKNALGINPEESRQIRNHFYGTLRADHFTSKLEAGEDHWKELKEQWIQNSPLLQSIISAGSAADSHHTTKMKAIEVLCRDVMKRLRDDQAKRDPSRKESNSTNSTTLSLPATAPSTRAPVSAKSRSTRTISSKNKTAAVATINNHNDKPADASLIASKALASTPLVSDVSDLQIDPSLLAAATIPSPSSTNDNSITNDDDQSKTTDASYPPPFSLPMSLRLHPASPLVPPAPFSDPASEAPARLLSRSIDLLKREAVKTLGVNGAHVSGATDQQKRNSKGCGHQKDERAKDHEAWEIEVEIDGVERLANPAGSSQEGGAGNGSNNGKEISWRIRTDDELAAYLEHMRGKTALFVCGFRETRLEI